MCFSYRVKVAFAGKTVAVVVKSNKTLQDALATILNKYRLRAQDATVTMVRGRSRLARTSILFFVETNSLTFFDGPQDYRETFTDFPVSLVIKLQLQK